MSRRVRAGLHAVLLGLGTAAGVGVLLLTLRSGSAEGAPGAAPPAAALRSTGLPPVGAKATAAPVQLPRPVATTPPANLASPVATVAATPRAAPSERATAVRPAPTGAAAIVCNDGFSYVVTPDQQRCTHHGGVRVAG